jgi:hypothetical protein
MTADFPRRARIAWTPATQEAGGDTMDDGLRKRAGRARAARDPEDIPDGLEAELYAYRDRLEAEALST